MIKALGLLLLFTNTSVFAQEDIALLDPFLSLKYTRGPYLLYDCRDKHWACVGKSEFNFCKESRDFQIKERRDKLGCVPVRTFNSEEECNLSQRGIINRSISSRFCVHPDIQEATRLESRD